ncbi:MAG: hypothetical protein ACW99G_15170 [Candidatus Thorarchaeota archaeon]|jgi:hypothetical protein
MTEVKMLTKISLLIYGLICTLYGVLTVFMTEMMEATLGIPMGPIYPRMLGGIFLTIAIFDFLILIKKDWDWEYIKFGFMLLYAMVLSSLIIEASYTALWFPTLSTEAIGFHAMNLLIMIILLILGIVSYMKQKE